MSNRLIWSRRGRYCSPRGIVKCFQRCRFCLRIVERACRNRLLLRSVDHSLLGNTTRYLTKLDATRRRICTANTVFYNQHPVKTLGEYVNNKDIARDISGFHCIWEHLQRRAQSGLRWRAQKKTTTEPSYLKQLQSNKERRNKLQTKVEPLSR